MKITIKGLDNLSRKQAEEILYRIFICCDQGFIKFQLRLRKIDGRTEIYHAFQGPWFYNKNVLKISREEEDWWRERPQQGLAQQESIQRVLDQSSIKDWIDAYSRTVPIQELVNKIAPSTGNKVELVAELEDQQTN